MIKTLIALVVSFHLFIIFVNMAAIFYLAANEPWYVSVPLISFLIRLATVERECPLTIVENWLREKAGKRKVRTFIGHYIVKHFYAIKNLFTR
jgi:hypothetical protein